MIVRVSLTGDARRSGEIFFEEEFLLRRSFAGRTQSDCLLFEIVFLKRNSPDLLFLL